MKDMILEWAFQSRVLKIVEREAIQLFLTNNIEYNRGKNLYGIDIDFAADENFTELSDLQVMKTLFSVYKEMIVLALIAVGRYHSMGSIQRRIFQFSLTISRGLLILPYRK